MLDRPSSLRQAIPAYSAYTGLQRQCNSLLYHHSCLISIMILLNGVYKKRLLSIMEFFFILNIIIIFQVSTYKEGPDSLWKSASCHLLVSSAFLVFIGILAYHVYLKISNFGFKKFCCCQGQSGTCTSSESQNWEAMRNYN